MYLANNVTSTGSGAINITGISGTGGSNNYGIVTDSSSRSIGGSSYSGNLTLQADTVSFGTGTSIQTTGNILIEPYTTTTAVNVNNGASGLALTTAYLGYLSGGSYTIGNANDTGTMTLGSASWNAPVSFLTKSTGAISVTGTQTGTGSATLSFTGPTTLGYAGTDATTNNQAITFNSAVTLGANATVNSGSALTTFGSTVNGGYNLTASAGTFSFASALGGTTPLAAVSLTSTNGLSLPAISAALDLRADDRRRVRPHADRPAHRLRRGHAHHAGGRAELHQQLWRDGAKHDRRRQPALAGLFDQPGQYTIGSLSEASAAFPAPMVARAPAWAAATACFTAIRRR